MRAHNVFHVSLLKKYVHDPNHVVDWNVVQMEPEGEFQVEPMRILNHREIMLQNRVIIQVKVQWKHPSLDETTWELEYVMHEAHPCFSIFITQRVVLLQG